MYETIEGTWEEILQHSAELTAQPVRLTVLPDKSANSPTTETLDQKLKGQIDVKITSSFSAIRPI